MKVISKAALAAASVFMCLASATMSLAGPVVTARVYSHNGEFPYFDDPAQPALLAEKDNILHGIAPVAEEGSIRSGYGNNGAYWETQGGREFDYGETS